MATKNKAKKVIRINLDRESDLVKRKVYFPKTWKQEEKGAHGSTLYCLASFDEKTDRGFVFSSPIGFGDAKTGLERLVSASRAALKAKEKAKAEK